MEKQLPGPGIRNSKGSLLRQALDLYLPYWPLALLFVLLATGISYLYLRYTAPGYSITATLIIKDEKRGYDDSKLMESFNLLYSKKIIENETEVLKSRTLMDKVVTALHLYAPVYEEGRVTSAPAYRTSPVVIEARDPYSIKPVEKVYFTYEKESGSVVLNGKQRCSLNKWSQTPYGVLRFTENDTYREGENETLFYFSLVKPEKKVKELISNLSVVPAGKTSTMLNLRLLDEVPRQGEDILNGLIAAYIRSSIDDKNNLVANTLSFVEKRLTVVSRELDSIERQIQQYRTGSAAIDVGAQGRLFLQNVSVNDQKASEVDMQLSMLGQVENFVLAKGNTGRIVPSTLGVHDPELSKLLDRLYMLEQEYEKLGKTVAENNPLLVTLRSQIKSIRPHILDNIRNQRKGLLASRKSLQASNEAFNSLLKTLPEKERRLLEISREQSIKSGIYSFLLQKREESALSYASTVSDCRVVDNAQANLKPVSPNGRIVYLTSVIISLGIFAGAVSIKDVWNRKILYRQDVEKLTSLPIIGEVPLGRINNPLVMEEGSRTFIGESFRKIRVSLPFLGINPERKTILVTSGIPGEGKSFIAANLALSLALTGKKVILLDFDLNAPSLEDMLNCKKEMGISEFLAGKCEPEEIIARTKQNENLFFIASGSLPPNPSELLANGRSGELIAYLEGIFDVLVLDSAPVVPVTDAYILSESCHATLFVVRYNHTPKSLFGRFDEMNKVNKLVNPAIICNGAKERDLYKFYYKENAGRRPQYEVSRKQNNK